MSLASDTPSSPGSRPWRGRFTGRRTLWPAWLRGPPLREGPGPGLAGLAPPTVNARGDFKVNLYVATGIQSDRSARPAGASGPSRAEPGRSCSRNASLSPVSRDSILPRYWSDTRIGAW